MFINFFIISPAVSPAIGVVIRGVYISHILFFFLPIAGVTGRKADCGSGFVGVYIIDFCAIFFMPGGMPKGKRIAVDFMPARVKACVITSAKGSIDRSAQ